MSTRTRRRKPVRKLNMIMRRKLVVLFGAVLLALVCLLLRITYINAASGDKYKQQVLTQSQQQYDSRVLPFKRGSIYDRNGTLLAVSNKVYHVILDCKVVNSDEKYVEPTVAALTSVLGINETEVRSLLSAEETKNSQYQILAKNLPMDKKKEFEKYVEIPEDANLTEEQKDAKQNVKGVWFEEDFLRTYPLNELGCDTIGFTYDGVNADYGIEGYYSSILNGVDGRQYGYFNENSDAELNIVEPVNGRSVMSTIDAGAQQIVEKYIQAFNEAMGAKNIGVVVMDPDNGDVISMATNDHYDLNDFRDLSTRYSKEAIKNMNDEQTVEALNKMWSNFCVTDAYEPGSVVKPIVVASALECGAIKEDDTFTCDGGWQYGASISEYIRCTGSHGTETLKEVIANSCNDAMMQIGEKMGMEKFIESQSLFNFGNRTGVDLPGESTGIVHTSSTMGSVELACSAFGQGYTCNMIQEAAGICAVVNGGNYYQPRLISKILDSDGRVIQNLSPTVMKQTISSNISADVRSYMEASVQQGTSRFSKVQGYSSGGKTGTAEKLPRGNNKYLVSFVGFAPVEKPEVVIYVVVDEPKADRQDNSAYPQYIAQGILSELLPYLNVKPDEIEEGAEIPTTELWEGFQGRLSGDKEDGVMVDDEGYLVDENGSWITDAYGNPQTPEEAGVHEEEGSFEGTADTNIPAPLEDDREVEMDNDLLSDGITNEQADYGQ